MISGKPQQQCKIANKIRYFLGFEENRHIETEIIDSLPARHLRNCTISDGRQPWRLSCLRDILHLAQAIIHDFSLYAHTDWWLSDKLQTGNKHAIRRQTKCWKLTSLKFFFWDFYRTKFPIIQYISFNWLNRQMSIYIFILNYRIKTKEYKCTLRIQQIVRIMCEQLFIFISNFEKNCIYRQIVNAIFSRSLLKAESWL